MNERFVSIHLPHGASAKMLADAHAIVDLVASFGNLAVLNTGVETAPAIVVAVAPVTPAVPGPIELDVNGLPWDARINSDPAKKNQGGDWKMKRGLEDATKAAVVMELRQIYPHPQIYPRPAPVAAAPPAPPVPVPPVTGAPPAPVAPAVPVVAASAAPAVVAQPACLTPSDGTFIGFMKKVGPAMAAGKLTNPKLLEILNSMGVTTIPALNDQPTMIPVIESLVDAEIASHA